MKDMNLKHCPFCGGEAVPVYSDKGSLYTSNILMLGEKGTVKCKKCEVRLPRIYSRVSKAIEAWNKRAEPTEQPKKSYTKADYMMCLHKEYGCNFILAEEAHNKALEYLRDKAMMHG